MNPKAPCRSSATIVGPGATPWLELKHTVLSDELANPEAQLRRFAAALTLDPAGPDFDTRPAPVAFGDDDEDEYDDIDDDDEDEDFDDEFDDEDDFDEDDDDFDEDEDEDDDFDEDEEDEDAVDDEE